jgi:hypothetical protein
MGTNPFPSTEAESEVIPHGNRLRPKWKQTQAPRMDRDVADLIENRKIPVYVVEEDLAERGIAGDELVSGVKLISNKALPGLFAEYEVISHW